MIKVTHEELIEKRKKLAEEIRNLDQEIEKQEQMKLQNIVVDIIKKLEELKKYNSFTTLSIETYCEGCLNDVDVSVDFDELIQVFKDYRERL